MDAELIVPCGMNCGICMAHLRTKDRCPGCRYLEAGVSVSLARCVARNCETIKTNSSGFCYECRTFPCRRVKQLDKRYTAKYHMSMMENLLMIKEQGIDALLTREAEKWRCPDCGGAVCCHNGICYGCGLEKLENRKKMFRRTDD